MANHKSALKRIRQNEKRRIRNKAVRTRVKNSTKTLRAAVEGKQSNEVVTGLLADTIRTLDRAASKGVIPQKRASRKIGRLTVYVNNYNAAQA